MAFLKSARSWRPSLPQDFASSPQRRHLRGASPRAARSILPPGVRTSRSRALPQGRPSSRAMQAFFRPTADPASRIPIRRANPAPLSSPISRMTCPPAERTFSWILRPACSMQNRSPSSLFGKPGTFRETWTTVNPSAKSRACALARPSLPSSTQARESITFHPKRTQGLQPPRAGIVPPGG